eukprot:TRINITY_DN120932_c0_g1_i1.p1 TRINITY_DN120932_c0_g1~~TRINITY_DN120932_c0_g1_i1.p1  ORF type:complete len:395 (+),score=105.79 TRINITY_DN120932_c0_g1_i1:70-1254(+)
MAQRRIAGLLLLGASQVHATRPSVKHAARHEESRLVEEAKDERSTLNQLPGVSFNLDEVMFQASNRLQWDKDQKKFLADEAVTQLHKEKNISQDVVNWGDEWAARLLETKAQVLTEVDDMLVEERNRAGQALNNTWTAMNASLGIVNSTIYSERERAANAALERDDLQMQIVSLTQTLQAQYCPPPSAPSFVGYNYVFDVVPNWVSQTVGCPDPLEPKSCLHENMGYDSFSEAWIRCGETEGCGKVMRYKLNGKYYLRRRSDLNSLVLAESLKRDDLDVSGDPLALVVNYVCMPICPTACQYPTCGHCSTGEFMAMPGKARCTVPKRADTRSVYNASSGNCPENTVDCRFCALDDLLEYKKATQGATQAAATTAAPAAAAGLAQESLAGGSNPR